MSSAQEAAYSPWRAIGQTAATLNVGTQNPMSAEIRNRPWAPASLSTNAKAMKELNRKPSLSTGCVVTFAQCDGQAKASKAGCTEQVRWPFSPMLVPANKKFGR
jgi:hypothetical protein